MKQLIFFLGGLLIFCSCNKQDVVDSEIAPTDREVNISIKARISDLESGTNNAISTSYTKAASEDPSVEVKNLWIIQIDGTSNNSKIIGEPIYITDFFDGITVALVECDNTSTIVYLANTFKDDFGFTPDTTLEDIKALSWENNNSESYFSTDGLSDERYMIMSGYQEVLLDGYLNLTITLKRSIAKITVNLTNKAYSGLLIESITLKNVPSVGYYLSSYLLPDIFPNGGDVINYSPIQDLAIEGDNTTQTFCFYMPVNKQGIVESATASTKPESASSTASYIEITASEIDGDQGRYSYKFYIGANLSTDYNVEANCNYIYDLSFTNRGDVDEDSRIERLPYVIAFKDDWTPSDIFNEVFELLDDDGNVVSTATSEITKYRFKEGKENWNGVSSAELMFYGCSNLTYIELPSSWGSVTSTYRMFRNCYGLTAIKLPSSWGEITNSENMFYYCLQLTSIELPSSWSNINAVSYMFYYCYRLQSVTIPASWDNITTADGMFNYCNALSSISLPSSWGNVTSIKSIFSNCQNLTSIKIPSSWGNISSAFALFSNCQSLTSIELPSSWGSITSTQAMFFRCYSLTSIVLPSSWGSVSGSAYEMFSYCSGLTSITLPSSWGSISTSSTTFSSCTGFTSRASGIEMGDGYYKSPSEGVFPSQCYRTGMGITLSY